MKERKQEKRNKNKNKNIIKKITSYLDKLKEGKLKICIEENQKVHIEIDKIKNIKLSKTIYTKNIKSSS